MTQNPGPLLGLRTVIYPAPDLAAAKDAFTALLGFGPYFDEPFYVGFEVAGYELGLDPNADPTVGPVPYWGVADLDAAVAALVATGATVRDEPAEPGDGIKVATLRTAHGEVVGLIENPNFAAAPRPPSAVGPGR